ncbi:LCCL domain-containing protein CCP2 [Babesia bovis T2Bo]|uniref:LCCL domain-containing protein CCP2, putative n=1 Tax=Babesia bovis TaxID=5865 RepID=A7ATR4_BABBO|nr:LCCL domain-containing protein CCP2 [Babesia bovis T2Bo]EDO06325.1 LCCL domain-containing protein CCP2 [Babesia bovis T2Bo]|eukprot:XP_001609893.1 LCCL domain-containing protein CCP2 [Babesia bovis T2Bo]
MVAIKTVFAASIVAAKAVRAIRYLEVPKDNAGNDRTDVTPESQKHTSGNIKDLETHHEDVRNIPGSQKKQGLQVPGAAETSDTTTKVQNEPSSDGTTVPNTGTDTSNSTLENSVKETNAGINRTKTLYGAIAANADSTFKALGSAGYRKYDATNAITKSGGYWCSEPNVLPDAVVSWTGELRGPRVLTGVSIFWVYAPQYVAVLAKRSREDEFEEVAPFQTVDPSEMTSVIQFKRKVDAQFVKIAMKGQINTYFGIDFVQFHGEPNPIFTIQAGITSIEDLCLQADETNDVVLDSCISAIASFKYNDIWAYNEKRQLYNPVSRLCMTLDYMVDTSEAIVVMRDCRKDGINSWDILPNNQIKVRMPGNLCVSQAGSSAGLANVALNKIATSSLPMKNDKSHNAESAVDGNLQSYWASESFTADSIPDKVEFIVNLQEQYKIRKLEIEWEAPALTYNIYTKLETDWILVEKIHASTSSKTVNDMHNVKARVIKLELIKPNPEYMNKNGQMHYGITSFAAYSNRLRTIVESCESAKKTKDARDKYFLQSVFEVDLHSGEPLIAAEKAIDTLVDNISNKITQIENLYSKMQHCKRTQVNALKRARDLEHIYEEVANKVYRFETQLELSSEPMLDEHLPADCIEIKNRGESSPSGFYHVYPPCATHSIRVYCDMYTGASYFLAEIESGWIGLERVYNTCRKYGLEPIHVHHKSQIDSISIMLKTMDIKDGLYPIAVKVGKRLKSLDLVEDVTDAIGTKDIHDNIAAVGIEGLQLIDGTKVDMSGIICSSNYSSIRLPPDVVKLGCKTRITEVPKLNEAALGVPIQIKCPQNCSLNSDDLECEGGNDGLYSIRTPICIAAIHSGEYSRNVTLEVKKAAAPTEFEGFYQNGIESTSVPSMVGDVAFTVERIQDECTYHKVEPKVNRNQKKSKPSVTVKPKSKVSTPTRLFNNPLKIDPATGDAIGALVTQVNQKSGKAAPVFLELFHHHTSETIAGAIQHIKLADMQRQPIEEIMNKLDDGVQNMENKIKWLAARVMYKKKPLIEGIKNMNRENAINRSYEPWSATAVTQSNLFEQFRAITVGDVQGVPKWTVSQLSLKGTAETVISQTSEFGVKGPLSGAMLCVSNAQYYDFIYSGALFPGGSGTLGMAFRVVDEDNYYLFQMVQLNGGYKRLIRVVNGDPYEIAKIEDGGFVDGVWYTIRIEARQCRIGIAVIQGLEPVFDIPNNSIDVIDCTHTSGSVGIFSGQINLVHFAKLHTETLPCLRYDKPPPPPKPPICSLYRETYATGITTNWRIVANGGQWNFEENVGGEPKVMAHRQHQTVDNNPEPSMALLKGGRSCKAGVFRTAMFPQCDPTGAMGLLVHFIDGGNYVSFECTGRQCAIIQMHKGMKNTLATTELAKIITGQWNFAEVVFRKDAVTASIGTLEPEAIFINTAIIEEVELGGTVGLYSMGCAGCAFAEIGLKPNYAGSTQPNVQQKNATEEQCLAVDRLEHCKSIAPSKIAACEADYCAMCCEQHHIDAPTAQDICYQRCRGQDHLAVLLQTTADTYWRQCAQKLDSQNNTQNAEAITDCELCCESTRIIQGVPNSVNRAAKTRCKTLCNT